MTISSEDLKLVCNYTESYKNSTPTTQISYMDFIEDPNQSYMMELKRQNRNLAIDAIVENKTEEYKSRDKQWIDVTDNENYIPSVSVVVKSQTIARKSYTELSDIYRDILNKLDMLTLKPMYMSSHYTTFDVNSQKGTNLNKLENSLSVSKKVLTNIIILSNLIASTGRRGPAKTVLMGKDAYYYFGLSNPALKENNSISKSIFNGLDIVPTNLISRNKVIVIRTEQKVETGLNVIIFPNDMAYYISETTSWEKQIMWFEII